MTSRNYTIILLVGVGMFLLSTFLATYPSNRQLGAFDKILRAEIVFAEGEYVPNPSSYFGGDYVGRVAIPLKGAYALATLVILVGIGGLWLSNKQQN